MLRDAGANPGKNPGRLSIVMLPSGLTTTGSFRIVFVMLASGCPSGCPTMPKGCNEIAATGGADGTIKGIGMAVIAGI